MKKAKMFKLFLVLTVVLAMLIASAAMASAATYGLLTFAEENTDATVPEPVVDENATDENAAVDENAVVEEEAVEEDVIPEPAPVPGAFKIMSYMWPSINLDIKIIEPF